MRNSRILVPLGLISLLTLGGCFGGSSSSSSNTPPAPNPPTTPMPPASPVTFETFVATRFASTSDTRDPVQVDDLVLDASNEDPAAYDALLANYQ